MSEIGIFISNIKALIKVGETNVSDLARKSGLSRGLIHNYLKRTNVPSLENAELLAHALGRSLASMLGKEPPASIQPRQASADEMALFVLSKLGLPSDHLKAIRLLLKADDDDIQFILKTLNGEGLPASAESDESDAG